MKAIGSLRSLGIALAAMLVLSGVAAGMAHAGKAPRWKVAGAFLGETEEKNFEGKNTEWLRLEVPVKTTLLLEFPAGECKETGKIKGSKMEMPGTKKEVVLSCTGVVVLSPAGCTVNSVGKAAGTVVTNKLKATLVWKNSTLGSTLELLSAEAAGGSIGEIEVQGGGCPAEVKGKYPIKEEVLGEVKPVTEEQNAGTVILPEPMYTEWWDNQATRVKNTITQLTVGGTTSVLRGTFSYELKPQQKFGVYEG